MCSVNRCVDGGDMQEDNRFLWRRRTTNEMDFIFICNSIFRFCMIPMWVSWEIAKSQANLYCNCHIWFDWEPKDSHKNTINNSWALYCVVVSGLSLLHTHTRHTLTNGGTEQWIFGPNAEIFYDVFRFGSEKLTRRRIIIESGPRPNMDDSPKLLRKEKRNCMREIVHNFNFVVNESFLFFRFLCS